MDVGKVGLAMGGVVLVGAIGVVALGGSLQMDANTPVGPFVIQMPTELFNFQADDTLVVAPEVIAEPEAELIAIPELELDAVVAPPPVVDEVDTAEDVIKSDVVQAAAASQALVASEAAVAAHSGCSGGY
jgi:hypothetical protein